MASRIKRTYIVNGVTNLCSVTNFLIAVGPDHDPSREVVVMRVLHYPPKKL